MRGAWPQAADVPLDDVEEAEEVDDDAAEAAGFASDVDDDESDVLADESDVFEDDDVAGVLLDEEPRLSFR